MKIVICIEGADGSGKSRLSEELVKLCSERGLTSRVIGRKAVDATPAIGAITALSQDRRQTHKIDSPDADIHLRLAREHLRAEECGRSSADIVVLDRFVLSVLSRVRINCLDDERLVSQLRGIAAKAELGATLYCECPFEVAWSRVTASVESGERESLSPKEERGPEYLRALHDIMKDDFNELDWIGDKYAIDTASGIEIMRHQLSGVFDRMAAGLDAAGTKSSRVRST